VSSGRGEASRWLDAQRRARVRRWLALLLGLAIAIVAGFLLLSGSVPIEKSVRPQAVPHADIDEQTEEQLLEILRAADREGG
jgi:hypothetical protein